LHIRDANFNATTHFDTWWRHVTRDWFTSVADNIFAKLFEKWPLAIQDATSSNAAIETGMLHLWLQDLSSTMYIIIVISQLFLLQVTWPKSSTSIALPKKGRLIKRNHSAMTSNVPTSLRALYYQAL